MRRIAALALLAALVAATSHHTAGFKLVVFPLSEKTHMLVALRLAAELVQRGHEVHVLTAECYQPFAEEVMAQMLEDSSSSSSNGSGSLAWVPYAQNCSYFQEDNRRNQLANPARGIASILLNIVRRGDEILGNEALMQTLRGIDADLMVNDVMSFGMFVALKLGVRNVDLDVGTAGSLWEPVLYGSESSGTFLPAVGTFLPTNGMNLLQRAANVAASKLSEAGLKWAIWGKHGWVADIVARHNVPLKRPYNNYMLLLTNSHFVLEAPRALAPNTKYIGPMLPSPPKPLPPGLASWMDGCPDPGCVYVSFGGMLQAPLAASRTLAAAMAAMPGVRFVWSLSLEQQVALSEQLASLANVHIAEWVPQNDLLGHPRTAAFVTQGGYLSMAEAAWHAVPVLGLPFIPGQGEIIQYAQDSGRALRIRGDTLAAGRADEFGAALRALLSNRSYADAAAVAAARIRATPRPYAQQAAEWVEYAAALRQHGPFLNPQKLHLTWWQQAALDVVGLYAALAAMPAAALCWCVSGAVRRWRYSRAGARPAAVRATITLLGAKKEA